MSIITLRNKRRVGDFINPYIVAELNTSHFGDIEIAMRMIDQAKEAGCDCVKFQSWSAESLYSESFYKSNSIAKRIIKKFAFDNSQIKELSKYAGLKKIDFASTPYSIDEARFLVDECSVPFIKIASMELNNLSYLKELAELGVPLVLSTGMGTLDEIFKAVSVIHAAGNNQLIILHCTSIYPAPPHIIRLQNIVGLRSEFPEYPIGYSDHSVGIEIPVASIALGACLIEKHFTLDSSRIGMDNQMAMEPDDMRTMILACRRVNEAMGGAGRVLGEEEIEQASKMRRSIVTKHALKAGCILAESDLTLKRPGTGLPPNQIQGLIGKKINQDLEAETLINWEMFQIE